MDFVCYAARYFSDLGRVVMIQTTPTGNNSRPLADLLGEVKEQAGEFVATHLQMLVSEMVENYISSKKALICGLLASMLLASAYLLLTLALVGLIAAAFWNNPYAWFIAFLIAGLLWSIGGTPFAIAAKAAFRGRTPTRTTKVLKADKGLFESEPKDQTHDYCTELYAGVARR